MTSGVVALKIEPDDAHLFVKAHPKHPPWIATLEVTAALVGQAVAFCRAVTAATSVEGS
jgi:hypothetical protein